MSAMKDTPSSFRRIGNYIFGIYFLTATGLLAELFLLEHFEGFWQILPGALISVGLIVMIWFYFSKNEVSKKTARGVMVLMVLSGGIGLWMHYNGNTEFELELHPTVKGFELFWNSMKGATPVLAPGAIVGLGLTGWVYTIMTAAEDSEIILTNQ